MEAGIEWPELVDYLLETQRGQQRQWGIIQKQTGADRLSLGGALAANVHGRGLHFKPIIADVESFRLVDARGNLRTCNRRENAELFRLAVGDELLPLLRYIGSCHRLHEVLGNGRLRWRRWFLDCGHNYGLIVVHGKVLSSSARDDFEF